MKQYFKIGPAMCKTLGIPEGMIFPVISTENNTVGGKGFDTFVFLDNPAWINDIYVGKLEMFAARGEFVTEADYKAQWLQPDIKEKAAKLTKAGYMNVDHGMWKKPSKKHANRWLVIDLESNVAYMEDQYGRVTTDMDLVDWSKFNA